MPRTPHYLTLSQAAKQTGKSKSVISKALKEGTLSFAEKDDSGYKIDPAELFRVFPQNAVSERRTERSETPARTPANDVENVSKLSMLEARVDLLQQRIHDKDERIAELKEERDRCYFQANRLLTYQPDEPAETPAEAQKPEEGGEGAAESEHPAQRLNLTRYGAVALSLVAILIAVWMFQADLRSAIGNGSEDSARRNSLTTPGYTPAPGR